jgi:hypothetical protein
MRTAYLLLIALCLGATHLVHAEPSLDETLINDHEVTIGAETYKITVLRNAARADHWYYIPIEPRLVERGSGDTVKPEFALLRYQYPDPTTPQKLIEGGLLQFSVTLDLPAGALDQLRKKVAAASGIDEKRVMLSAIVPKEAEVAVYSPKDGILIGTGALGQSIAPSFSTQKMAFTLQLTRAGADIYDALTSGQTGVQVGVLMTYTALRPAAKFNVIVDYQQAYKHYSTSVSTRGRAGWGGWFSVRSSADIQKIREELVNSGVLEIDAQAGNDVTYEQLDKYMIPILERINKEILDTVAPPPKIEPAQTGGSAPKRGLFGGSYAFAMKDYRSVRRTKETVKLTLSAIVERKTAPSGFVGIGAYPEALRKELVVDVKNVSWDAAYFMLPAVTDEEEYGLSQVDLLVALRRAGANLETQTMKWMPDRGWFDKDGTARTALAFPLQGRIPSGNNLRNAGLTFDTTLIITRGSDVTTIKRTQDAFNSDNQPSTPLSYVDVFGVDVSRLSWTQISPTSTLKSVTARLKVGDQVYTRTFQPRNTAQGLAPPRNAVWFVEKGDKPVVLDVSYSLTGNRTVPWNRTGTNLRDPVALEYIVSLEQP